MGSFLFFLDLDFLNYLLLGDRNPVKGDWACGWEAQGVVPALSLSNFRESFHPPPQSSVPSAVK